MENTVYVGVVRSQLKALREATNRNIDSVRRKRSWRPSQKAMALANYEERIRVILALELLVTNMNRNQGVTEFEFSR